MTLIFRIWNTKLLSWLKYTGGSNQWATDIHFNENGTFQAFRFQVRSELLKFLLLLRKMTERAILMILI